MPSKSKMKELGQEYFVINPWRLCFSV